jgi:hypothetical protein
MISNYTPLHTDEMNSARPPPAGLQTPGFAHYSVAWSPFHNSRIALASSANFGLVGNGRLHMASLIPGVGGSSAVKLDKQSVYRLDFLAGAHLYIKIRDPGWGLRRCMVRDSRESTGHRLWGWNDQAVGCYAKCMPISTRVRFWVNPNRYSCSGLSNTLLA